MQANGRFQCWNSKGSQQGLVEAAATDLKHFRRFRVWSLANGRLERSKNRGLEQQGQRLCARKGQVATLAQDMLTATGLGGTAKAHRRAWWKLPQRI